jgi:DNA-binding beta-propeller fold protein YncE
MYNGRRCHILTRWFFLPMENMYSLLTWEQTGYINILSMAAIRKNVLTAANDPGYVTVDDGFGPRHMTFSPDGKTAYLLNELAGNIIVFDYADGKFTPKQTLLLLPPVIRTITEVPK